MTNTFREAMDRVTAVMEGLPIASVYENAWIMERNKIAYIFDNLTACYHFDLKLLAEQYVKDNDPVYKNVNSATH